MKYYFYLVLAVLFWSGNFVLGRYVSSNISAMELSFFRWFFVLLILSPYIFINYKRLINIFSKNPLLYILFGSLGVSSYNTFIYFGLDYIPATNALLINSSTPIFIIILSSIILSGAGRAPALRRSATCDASCTVKLPEITPDP